MLGKALGGGLYPVSAFLARRDILERFTPGDHGSTFGGNPLAAAIASEALDILVDDALIDNSATMGRYFIHALRALESPLITAIRGRGLLLGIEIDPRQATAQDVCKRLMEHGILTKETHETVVRLAPPLIIDKPKIDWAVERIQATLKTFAIKQ
jgi:ornithine--oxo-acid transaminase